MKKTILVIEDNEKSRFLFEDMLSDEGYEVVTAGDGDEVKQKMVERKQSGKPFDLLLVDLAVPQFNPIKFIKDNIKTHRILVISAYMDSFDLKGILKEKWKIKKPFDNNDLIARVKDRLKEPIKEDNQ